MRRKAIAARWSVVRPAWLGDLFRHGQRPVSGAAQVPWVLLSLVFTLNTLDGLTTWSLVAQGSIEINPVLSWMVVNADLPGMLFFKVAAGVLFTGLLAMFHWHKYARRITQAVVLGLGLVVAHNLVAMMITSSIM